MREWISQRDIFLSAILDHEALPADNKCSNCQETDGHLRCKDCFGYQLLCQPCCLLLHKTLPFHILERWNDGFFSETSLHAEGYILHLGHAGDPCPKQSLPEMDDYLVEDPADQWIDDNEDPLLGQWERFEGDIMVIVDCGAVHQRRVQWCHCSNAPERHIQLLQHGLYPASLHRPRTAFTFQVLKYFWIDAVECKTSAMNFFSKLRRLTNYCMPHRVPVSVVYITQRKYML